MEDRREELKEEYLFLQKTYEDFDTRALQIKGWCTTVSLGAVALGFSSDGEFSFALFSFITLTSLMFWGIEAKWKTFQYANAYRIRVLEAYFRGDEAYKNITPFQIYNSWFRAYTDNPPVHEYEKRSIDRTPLSRTIENAFKPLVFIPYLPIIVISIFCVIAF